MAEEIKYRPKLKIKWNIWDYFLEVLSLIILASMWVYVATNYADLPEKIAHHFDLKGNPDRWGSKSIIWVMPFIATLLWILLSAINSFPHTFNYITILNEANVEYQYRLATRLIRTIKLVVLGLFFFGVYSMKMSVSNSNNIPNINIFALLGTLMIILMLYFYLTRKKK